jgi:hypothetical protein
MTAADLDMARADLAPLFESGYVRELTALYISEVNGAENKQIAALRTDDLDTALQFAADHDRAGAVGIYTGVNPLDMPTGAGRGESKHVPWREALFLDFDVTAAKAEKRPATEAERRQAYEAAMHHAFPLLQRHGLTGAAQRIGTSGNGYYLLIALEHVPNDAEHRAMIGAAVDALNVVMPAGIDVDRKAATDAVRVRRMSGTVNRNNGGDGRCDLKHHPHSKPLPVDVLQAIGSAGRQSTGPDATAGESRDPGAIVPRRE